MLTIRQYVLVMVCVVLGGMAVHAQTGHPGADNMRAALGAGNAGRDFWLAFPANWDFPGSTAYYIRLYITSTVRTRVRVWAGAGLKKVLYTVPNKISTVDLTPLEAQMLVRDDRPQVPPDRVFRKKAVHVQSDAPVIVYGVNRTTYTSEGLLALPTNALGREYIVASYGAVIGESQELPSQYMVIAPYNGTVVSIYHPHRTLNHAAGESFTVELDSGDVWSAMTVGYGGDMSGAIVRSNKPVAVTAGQQCTYIPNLLNFCCCNHITEMMLPTSSWGRTYHAVPFHPRLKGDFYRVFAKEADTRVSINGIYYQTLSAVGGMEGAGWLEYRAADKNVVEFTADKPIYVTQYNTSQYYDNVPSDPFYLLLTPVEQYQTSLIFCTPEADFPKNFLNFVCEEEGFHDVEITIASENAWEPLWKMSGAGVPKKFPSKINGKSYVGLTIEMKPGAYRMRGRTPFGGYLYGYTSFDSYGYPLSFAVSDLAKPDTIPPAVATTMQSCLGTVEKTVTDAPDDESIRANLATVELDPDPSSTDNYELLVKPFEAGVSRSTTYTLKVTDLTKPARAVVIISDMAGNVRFDTLVYSPLNIALLPSPSDYGKVRAGEKVQRTLRIRNNADLPAELKEILLKSGQENFEILSPNGVVSIAGKDSIDVTIEFTADLRGKTEGLAVYEDSVGVRDECGLRYLALVKGQVVKPRIDVTDHDFGRISVNTASPAWQMEVRNIAKIEGSTLTVYARSGPENPGVQVFDIIRGDATPLFTLEPGESRMLEIVATPASDRTYNDTIFFSSDAVNDGSMDTIGWLEVTGTSVVASVGGDAMPVARIELSPNPINHDEAVLSYSLTRSGVLRVVLVDVTGREIRELAPARYQEAGDRTLRLNMAGVPAGSYLVRIETDDDRVMRKLVVVR